MSHTIYHSEAFIMSSKNSGEADKVYKIFTKDLGIITAKATGIRKIESRLSYFVQDFKYIEGSFVRGRNFWRLVSAKPIHELNSKESLATPSRIRSLQLIQKLSPEEEPLVNLFNELVSAYSFTSENHPIGENMQSVEALIAVKILYALGYWGDEQSDDDFVKSPFNIDSIDKIKKVKKTIIKELNNSLRVTGLI